MCKNFKCSEDVLSDGEILFQTVERVLQARLLTGVLRNHNNIRS